MKKNILYGAENLEVSRLGLGTVKFGRNEQVKYPTSFDLPSDKEIESLLELAKSEGINLLDTAPAYGTSETRLGNIFGGTKSKREDWVIVTKAGEEFIDGKSVFDFSAAAISASIERTLKRLHTDRVDCVLLHSDGNDVDILQNSGAVEALQKLRAEGKVLSIGISTKTIDGGLLSIDLGLDAVMITYNPWHTSEEPILDRAVARGDCSVFIKKAFGSGWFGKTAEDGESDGKEDKDPVFRAFDYIFRHPGATAVISGTINPKHLKENATAMCRVANWPKIQD